jgi:hypothetical protein
MKRAPAALVLIVVTMVTNAPLTGIVRAQVLYQVVPVPTPPASPKEEPWWGDPRWWAIGVTAGLTLLSLALQAKFRLSDNRTKARSEDFDSDVRVPVRQTYPALRSLAAEVSCVCNTIDNAERNRLVTEVREKSASKAFTAFSLALVEVEQRLGLKGTLSDVNADLEDLFYEEMAKIPTCQNASDLRKCSRHVCEAIFSAVAACDRLLSAERTKYCKKKT